MMYKLVDVDHGYSLRQIGSCAESSYELRFRSAGRFVEVDSLIL